MKITFIIPNLAGGKHFLQPPLDTLYSISNLKANGHECSFIDNRVQQLNFEELTKQVPKSDVIVVNTAPYDFSQMYHFDYRLSYSLATANFLKQKNPHTPLVLTGIHVNVQPDQIMTNTNADVAIWGEVDRSIVTLMNAIAKRTPLEEVNNLIIKKKDTLVFTSMDNEMAHPTLDGILMPDYSSIDINDYYGYELRNDRFQRVNKWAVMLGSRGCPYSCNFCHNFWGNKVRYRSVESVVDEAEQLDKNYGAKYLFFLDSNFTLNKEWAKGIAQGMMKKEIQLKWSVETRFDLVDEELVEHLANAGCTQICYGLESYNDDVLQKMNKKIDTALVNDVIRITRSKGITPCMFVMLGVPGETKQGIQNTIDFLRKEELPYIAIVYGSRFGTTFQKQYQQHLGREMHWNDILDSKGIIDNEIDSVYLAKVVRYLRKQNVLRDTSEAGELP